MAYKKSVGLSGKHWRTSLKFQTSVFVLLVFFMLDVFGLRMICPSKIL
jgi:hypothetical protein